MLVCGCVALGAAAAHPRRQSAPHIATPGGGRASPNATLLPAPKTPSPEFRMDVSGALPAKDAARLPSTEQQFHVLKQEIDAKRPQAEEARRRSELLNAEAAELHQRLDETTSRVQTLDADKGRIDAELARLGPEEHKMTRDFASDRARVIRLLAVLERLQSDMPPVIAIRSDDALSAARGAIVLGDVLPRIYHAAADLSVQLHALKTERQELTIRQRESVRVAAQLSVARSELDQLLAIKSQEADAATAQFGDLEARLEAAAGQAATLESLLAKAAELRAHPEGQGIVTVTASAAAVPRGPRRGTMVWPVAGTVLPGGVDGVGGPRAPGITLLAPQGSDVVSPADGQVLFAGSYHKAGKVLILEMPGGYDLVLAGLDRLDIRPGDELLAGEPVGAMSRAGAGSKLYFELRQNGKGINPASWMEVGQRKAKRL